MAGVSIFVCNRSSDRKRCSTSGCNNYAVVACTFALQGKAQGKTCGRPVCDGCAPNKVCPPHQRLTAKVQAMERRT